MTVERLRELYKSLTPIQTHLAQSSEIAMTGVCPFLLRLKDRFGVPSSGSREFIVGNAVHELLRIVSRGPLLENWQNNVQDVDALARKIECDSVDAIKLTLQDSIDTQHRFGNVIPVGYEDILRDRFHGILVGFIKRIMKKYEKPKNVLTEITITNIKGHQEGRLDAILEFDKGFAILDWKSYDDKPHSGGGAKYQLIANLLLANYRYTGDENDWSQCIFGAVVYYNGAFIPRIPISVDMLAKVKDDRAYVHEVLCGRNPPTQKPPFCAVCDTGAIKSEECQFYKRDQIASSKGLNPPQYETIRRSLLSRRYIINEERAITHRKKFLVQAAIDEFGEADALVQLEKVRTLGCGYKVQSIEGKEITLSKENGFKFVDKRQPLRVIGKEEGISLLSCVSVNGFCKRLNEKELVIEISAGPLAAQIAYYQLKDLPIILMEDEINLQSRVMEPAHFFHKLAAESMLPWEGDSIADKS